MLFWFWRHRAISRNCFLRLSNQTSTITNDPTLTWMSTITNDPTLTWMSTITNDPTLTWMSTITNDPTLTWMSTITNDPTLTLMSTITNDPTLTWMSTITNDPTLTWMEEHIYILAASTIAKSDIYNVSAFLAEYGYLLWQIKSLESANLWLT